MTFQDLEGRLRALLQEKLRRGEISQRQLARLTGFTQPHIHNVLKGARAMSRELADALLECLELSVRELVETAEPQCDVFGKVPLSRGLVGPHNAFPDRAADAGHLLFAASFLARLSRPILLRLAAEEDTMAPLIEPGDLILVDRAEAVRRQPAFESIYLVSLNAGSAVCRCQQVGSSLVLIEENHRRSFRLPDRVPLVKCSILDIVRGKVVWACREFDQIMDRIS